MMSIVWVGCLTIGFTLPVAGQDGETDSIRAKLKASITGRSAASWEAAKKIWLWAEPGYQEKKSAALLKQMLREQGFEIRENVAKIPTAFIAQFGSEKPVIGVLGEYDALPGLCQAAEPVRQLESRQVEAEVNYGHACGHHLFGVGSASAAIAVAERIKAGDLKGTIRFYGCPAEEGGGAKAFMVREGLFSDCDIALHWHPGSSNVVGDRTCLARVAVKFRFHGKSAHAAGAPEQGRSALDAVELTNFAAQLLREHTPDFTRIHHVITAGGGAPNVVPDFCEVYYYLRHPQAEVVRQLYPRLLKCAQAGAVGTETKLEVQYLGGTLELLPNQGLARLIKKNLQAGDRIEYTEDERQFALRIQTTLAKPKPLSNVSQIFDRSGQLGKGSTDVGDVSWVTPTGGFSTVCWAPGTPGHSWQAVAAGGTSLGKKGMDLAAQVLAATAGDLMRNPQLVTAAKEEHRLRLGQRKYKSLLEAGQKPPLDYRNPPRRRLLPSAVSPEPPAPSNPAR